MPQIVDHHRQTSFVPSITALVEPSLLSWARKTANLQPVSAARKIGVPEGRVEEWEAGKSRPTIAQLREAARVYRRPLGVFFLPEPPQAFETLRDFRRIYGSGEAEWSAALHDEYRRAHAQREALLEIAELDGINPSSAWRLHNLPDEDQSIAAAARRALESAAPLDYPTPAADEYRHLAYWISALEHLGVLVVQTRGGQVETDEMRAFSLYFDEVPVIALNGADWPRGRLFSAIHEYAHLVLHTSGLCDTTTDARATTEDRRLEARCNAIAAEILMPAADVLGSEMVNERPPGHEWTLPELMDAAKPFGVSVESFLRRLVTLGRVPMEFYRTFREGRTERDLRGNRSSGGSFYLTKARDLGRGYVRTVADAHNRNVIDSATAAAFLDVKVNQIRKLAEKARL
jgi:Zn-dependent peptidase ImmA (M78 family)/DNA-binding transcriptional regulator YiaG